MKILITGGAGFIGSALIRHLIRHHDHDIINFDKLTYSGNLESLNDVSKSSNYVFVQADICEGSVVQETLETYQPDAIMHLAAESHVDRSIDSPSAFMQTNIVGTFTLLEAARRYWHSLPAEKASRFRFHHISTDEVYGDLNASDSPFDEAHSYQPSSPYAASKASSDHLVRAWHRTFGFPILITNCSNNYGPFHFPEKLIPLMILNALDGKPLPVYGDGQQIRDWLFVEDHVIALHQVLLKGRPGETYNIGGHNEVKNIDVVKHICALLDELNPSPDGPYQRLITFVQDRPGHDLRYAINATKIETELGWTPKESFDTGLRKTVQWVLDNQAWCTRVQKGQHFTQRQGIG